MRRVMIGERSNEGYILAYPSSLSGHGLVMRGPLSLRGSMMAMRVFGNDNGGRK